MRGDETDDEIINEPDMGPDEDTPEDEEKSWGDRMLAPDRPLSPRHRKLAELAAQGLRNGEIARQLGYTESRVSILKSNGKIRDLINQIAERIYEESVGARLRALNEPALNEITKCLADRTNRYKEQLKVDTAKWIVEMNHGKAKQTHDIGENTLALVMDKLDALKATGKSIEDAPREAIDVTPVRQIAGNSPENAATPEDDALKKWVEEFAGLPKA